MERTVLNTIEDQMRSMKCHWSATIGTLICNMLQSKGSELSSCSQKGLLIKDEYCNYRSQRIDGMRLQPDHFHRQEDYVKMSLIKGLTKMEMIYFFEIRSGKKTWKKWIHSHMNLFLYDSFCWRSLWSSREVTKITSCLFLSFLQSSLNLLDDAKGDRDSNLDKEILSDLMHFKKQIGITVFIATHFVKVAKGLNR